MRNVDEPSDEEIRRRKSKRVEQTSGKEHERGDKNPGVHPEAKADGQSSDL